jgi:hypothetical protein
MFVKVGQEEFLERGVFRGQGCVEAREAARRAAHVLDALNA